MITRAIFPGMSHRNLRKNAALGCKPGFALVVSLSLMVLLVVLAIGLLALSSVSLRASGRVEAMAAARGNARLAMVLAIGQLQKSAGPDQRITAPGSLLNPGVHPSLTGVWESRKLSRDGDPDLDAAKRKPRSSDAADGEFLGWLASGSLLNPQATPDQVPPGGLGNATAMLIGDSGSPAGELRSEVLPVGADGGLSWATIDEGVKARFDLAAGESLDRDATLSRLRAPSRAAPESVEGLSDFDLESVQSGKMVSYRTAEFAAEDRTGFGKHFHDLTPWSASLPVNAAEGGLKADLTHAFEQATLPPQLSGRHVFSNSKVPLAPADPLFASLAGFYRLHASSAGGTKALSVAVPPGYRPLKSERGTNVPNPSAVNGMLVAPVVTRVSVVFSLVSREAHGNWAASVPATTGDAQRRYMVYLIYTPVVTLYNPYNTPLNVSHVKVSFKHLPLAFRFFRNGIAQTNAPALLSQFHISSESRDDWEDQFSVTLSNTPGSASGANLALGPGEARVFGVNHPRGTLWANMTNYLWQNDLATSKTLNLFSGPGWNYRSGFIVDWLRPAAAGRTADNGSLGVFGARGNDTIDVACSPEMPGGSNGQFSVEVSARVGSRDTALGAYRYRYGNREKLTESLKSGSHPSLGAIEFPFRREKPWRLNEIYQPNVETTPVEQWTGPKQFAIFTLVDRTALDSLNPVIPGRHTSFCHPVLDMDVTRAHPAQMPMEMSFMPIRGDGANVVGSIDVAPDETNRAYHFSGTRLLTGSLNYPSIQVPAGSPVNVGTFRHANLANSGHLPLRAHTVGESAAHPLIPADNAIATTGPFGYPMTDSSWLANHTLWDGAYFSALREMQRIFGPFVG